MEKENSKTTAAIGAAFLAYSALMLWLLFDRQQYNAGLSYWDQVAINQNFVPFQTIGLYVRLLFNTDNAYLIRHAIINLFGNVGMFIPLGLFLPALWPKLRTFWKCWLFTTLVIAVVEVTQLFTLLGSCDIDDLILNLVGVSIGFGLYKLCMKLVTKKKNEAA